MSEIRVKSTGKIKLFESDNTSSVTIASPASLSANRVITVPDADVNLTNIATNTAKTSNATHSGEVTGATALTIADNIVDEANLKVSNSAVNGYMLTSQSAASGGLTWAAAPSASIFGAVGFTARLTTGANLNDATTTVIIFNDEIYDTNSAYNVSDGIFTVPVAGRYLFGVTLQFADSNGNMSDMQSYLSINDNADDILRAESTSNATTFTKNSLTWTGIIAALSVNDTVKIKARIDTNNGSGAAVLHGDNKSIFWGVNIA